MNRNLRDRRLASDYRELMEYAKKKQQLVTIKELGGNPPTRYRIIYHCRGYIRDGNHHRLVNRHEFVVEIPSGYPSSQSDYPRFVPKGNTVDLVHPNNMRSYLCMGHGHQTARPLVDMVIQAGKMVAGQLFDEDRPADNHYLRNKGLNQPADPNADFEIAVERSSSRQIPAARTDNKADNLNMNLRPRQTKTSKPTKDQDGHEDHKLDMNLRIRKK